MSAADNPGTGLPAMLRDGYARFRGDRYPRDEKTYRALAEGQQPPVMVVSCSDSRVDPAAIFDAGPGRLFVVRNVANLVPPWAPDGGCYSTGAALEFAVTTLKVRDIAVLGHSGCGGIAAFLACRSCAPARPTLVDRWIANIRGALDRLPADAPKEGPGLQTALEYASILNSLDNLLTFPFVREAVEAGRLGLHGAHFSIPDGRLHALDRETGAISAVA